MLSNHAEIVQDSEPEREAARLGARELRRRKRTAEIANFAYETNETTSDPDQAPVMKLLDSSSLVEEVQTAPGPGPHNDLHPRGVGYGEGIDRSATAPVPHDSTDVIVIEDSDEPEGPHSDMRQRLAGFRYESTVPSSRASSVHPGIMQRPTSATSSSSKGSRSSSTGPPIAPSIPVSRIDSSETAPTAPPAPTVPKMRARRPAFYPCFSAFTDVQLARLSRCVSCELKWTARKTVVEKVKHIAACAKKHHLVDETLSSLLEQETRKKPEDAQSSTKKSGNKVLKADDEAPKTLFDRVQEVDERKRGRRPAVSATVQGPAVMRRAILDRARNVLGDNSMVDYNRKHSAAITNSEAPLARPPAIAIISDPTVDEPPLTQPFARSALAVGQSKSSLLPTEAPRSLLLLSDNASPTGHIDDNNHDIPPLPTTQAFGSSSLGNRQATTFGASRHSLFWEGNRVSKSEIALKENLDGHDDHRLKHANSTIWEVHSSSSEALIEEDLPASPHIPRDSNSPVSANAAAPPAGKTYDFSDHIPQFSPRNEALPTTNHILTERSLRSELYVNESVYQWDDYNDHAVQYEDNMWREDDAYLHWDPPPATAFNTQEPDQAMDQPLLLTSERPEDVGGREEAVPKRRKVKGKSRIPNDDAQDILDLNELESKMLNLIRADEDLYFRVLRYEPIDFEVFVRTAKKAGFAERGLKLALKTFLDKHAVQFYGAEGTVGRSRVKKRALI